MFKNENNWQQSQRNKTKKQRSKRSNSSNHKLSEHAKYSKAQKQQSHRKLSKIKHMNTISDYVGPERLTKHVGFFTKGKISDSISRIEKIMPKEIKARAKQDLKEVLKLTSVSKTKKYKKKHSCSHHSNSNKKQSVQSSFCTPQYLQHKTGFASNSWKDKLQQSVGLSAVNSVLDSVHEPVCNSSPVEKPQLLARKVLLTSIYPLIKKTNRSLFPKASKRVKLKEKLTLLKNKFSCNGLLSENSSCCSSVKENSQVSQSVSVTNHSVASLSSLTNNTSQSIIKEDFNLNPVFIDENIVQNDIQNIFPNFNDFLRNGDLVRGIDFVNITNNEKCDSEINSVTAPSSVGKSSSVVFTHNSPTSSNDSPAWKLQLSPVKFEPELGSTPTLYFRHKMF